MAGIFEAYHDKFIPQRSYLTERKAPNNAGSAFDANSERKKKDDPFSYFFSDIFLHDREVPIFRILLPAFYTSVVFLYILRYIKYVQ